MPVVLLMLATATTLAAAPFDAAEVAPADVTLYVHVDDAFGHWQRLRSRPVARWLETLLEQGQVPAAWRRLAEAGGLDGADLFQAVFGGPATVLVRGEQWAVIVEMDSARSRDLLARLSPRVLGPRRQVGRYELTLHGLVLARDTRRVVIGPAGDAALFAEVVSIMAAAGGPVLAAAEPEAMDAARGLGDASLAVYVRHGAPMGGWSVAAADLDGDVMTVRCESRFESAPFRSRVTDLAWDPAPLARLERGALAAMAEPADTAGGPFAAFLAATLGEPMLASVLGDNLGTRRLTAVFDRDGRLEDPPHDLLVPGVARLWEVRDASRAWEQLDGHVLAMIAALNGLGAGEFMLEPPDPRDLRPDAPRRVSAGPLARWLFGDLPGMDGVDLAWAVVTRPGSAGGWCVIASHPDHLAEVSAALRAPVEGAGPQGRVGRWTHCGTADGRRLAAHAGSWSAAADLIAAPGAAANLRQALALVRDLAGGVERCRWYLARPTAQSMRLDAEVRLSPSQSAAPPR